jgi:nucleotide-binding universal stress UspA family protein
MFKNVLVGVDGRTGGCDAIALASRLATPDGKLTLVHVHGGELRPSHAITPGLAAEEERGRAHKLLEEERVAAGVEANLISVVSGSAGRGLHEQAEEQHADLIVVGSCSHGACGRAMLGDDTRAALNGASCAVAVAPLGYAEHPRPIGRVGVAYNSSPESEAALAAAHSLAESSGGTVYAREVVTIPTVAYTGIMPPAIGESIDALLQEATSRMSKLRDAEGSAVYGLAGEELAAFGDQVDLLVVGSRGYGPVKRLVLGSTSDYLQRHVRSPLLVLPRTPINDPTDAGVHSSEDTIEAAV